MAETLDLMLKKKRESRMTTRVLTWRLAECFCIFYLRDTEGGAGLGVMGVMIQEFGFDFLHLKCLLYNQVEVSGRQVEAHVWSSEKRPSLGI